MPEPRFIQLPKVPQTFDERSMRNLMQAVRHNLQQIIDKGIGSGEFRSIYQDVIGGSTTAPVTAPTTTTPSVTPGPVSSLTATGAYSTILLDWIGPLETGWTHFEVWRHDASNLAEARRWARVEVEGYSDSPPIAGVPYYYWVRAANGDNFGPFAGPVSAEIVLDFDLIYDGIQNQIFNDPLFTALGGRVDLVEIDITAIEGDITAIEGDITAIEGDITAIEGDIVSINSQLADLSSVQPFDANVAYAVGDLVTYLGRLYICTQATVPPSPLPTDVLYWDDIGAYASLGEAVAAHSSQINANISDIAAEVVRTDQLYTDVYHVTTGLSAKASIAYVDQVESDIYGAAVTAFTQINAALYDPVTGLNVTKASVTQLNQAVADIYGAAVTAFTQINAALYDPVTGLNVTKASVTQLNQAVADIYGAAVSSFTQIAAEFNSVDSALNLKASISYVDTASADAESGAIASATQQVYTSLGGSQAVVEAKAASWDGTAAQWTVKAAVGELVGGVGLLNDGVLTRFYVQADRFAVYGSAVPGDPSLGVPFVVEGGVTYIKDAMIRNAAIKTAKIDDLAVTTAKIGNLQVTNAKIATLAVSKLEAGTISVGMTLTGSIVVSTSGFIRSGQTAYGTGAGWWLGISGGVPRFSIGNGSTNYLRWDGIALRTTKLVVDGAELHNSPLATSSARIHTGGGRTAPFVIYDINQAPGTAILPAFYSPSYLAGHYFKRLAFFNQDALFQVGVVVPGNPGETVNIVPVRLERRVNGGAWTLISTLGIIESNAGSTANKTETYVRRYTTPNTWNYLDFRVVATGGEVTVSVFFNNANESDPVNEDTGGTTPTTPVTPPVWEPPPGSIIP